MTKIIIEIREAKREPVITISGEQSFDCTQLEGDTFNKFKIEIEKIVYEKIKSQIG